MGYSIDGPTKVITLTAGTTSFSVRDLWSRWTDWFLTSDNSKYLPAMRNAGGDDIDLSEGTSIPIYVFLTNGWRIKPQEANHTLKVQDGILVVDGGGDPFINTTGSFIVRINYQQPVQAITVATGGGGGGGLTAEDVWTYSIRELTDTMEILTQVASVMKPVYPIDENFEPTMASPAPLNPGSIDDTCGANSSYEFKDFVVAYYDQPTKTWTTRPGEEALVPLDVRADVAVQQEAIDIYNSQLADYQQEYNIQREIQWRALCAQRLIDETT
jgi:hypothetical protein